MADTVTVACRHPHGLVLRVFDMVDAVEPTQTGSRDIKRAQQRGESVTIKGYSDRGAKIQAPAGMGAFALTAGVSKDFWDAWLVQNKDLDMVKRGLIFAATSNQAGDKAKERDDLKSGLEPLNPEALPGSVSRVESFDKVGA